MITMKQRKYSQYKTYVTVIQTDRSREMKFKKHIFHVKIERKKTSKSNRSSKIKKWNFHLYIAKKALNCFCMKTVLFSLGLSR